MPRQSIDHTGRRSAPYNLSISTTMPGPLYMPHGTAPPSDWQLSYDPVQNNMMPIHDVINPLPPTPHLQHPQNSPYLHQQPQLHTPHPHNQQHLTRVNQRHEQPPTPTYPQTGPWSSEDDAVLVRAKTSGMPWNAIQETHFPNKTGNACRKRYERLMSKNRRNDWDEERTARLAVAYKEMQRQIWSPLADRLGERWDHVEKACMDKGLRNILQIANNHSRSNSSRHLRPSSRRSNDQYLRAEREDSGVAFTGDPSSPRSSHSNSGAMPNIQQLLQPPQNQ